MINGILKVTVNYSHGIKSSGRVNYKIYGALIEWVSGEWSGREAAGELQTVVRWVAVTHRHSFSWDLFCVKGFAEWPWFIPAAGKARARGRMLVSGPPYLETSGANQRPAVPRLKAPSWDFFIRLRKPKLFRALVGNMLGECQRI